MFNSYNIVKTVLEKRRKDNTLDYIFTNNCNFKADIIDIHFSDHEGVLFTDDDKVIPRVNYV